LPTSTVSLTGSGSDADGTISSYAWTQVSGPNTATIATPSAATTNVSGLVQGNYVFRLTVTDNSGSTGTDDVTVTVQAAGSSTKIEAENYTSMSGIQTEPTSDVGGGLNVGWQDTGDWMNYSVNVSTAGTYTVNFRVATMFNGPQFQLRNSSGTVLATLNVPNTGGFQTWRTISAQVTLPAGQQTLRIHTSNAAGGWNINWWEIVKPQSAGGVNEAITTAATTSVALETSLDRVAAAPMAVYPNPVGDQLNLTINNDFSGRMRVDIINGSGMLVKTVALVKPEKGIHRISVPVNNLQRGNYVVRISMNQWIDSKKILKQ
jgi:endoglucanase